MATGWTWDYVEEQVDVPRLAAMSAYWEDYPPLHVMVAAYLGIGKAADAPAQTSDAQIEELMAMAAPLPEHLKANIPDPLAPLREYQAGLERRKQPHVR